MSGLLVYLAFIFLPGIIWARLDASYSSQVKPSKTDLLINVFVFGTVSYVITYLTYKVFFPPKFLSFDVSKITLPQKNDQFVINGNIVDEIIIATMFSIILSIGWLFVNNNKIIIRFLQFIGATNRYGDEDVWDFTFNSNDHQVRYVNFVDELTKTTFTGYIEVFSETPSLRELVLKDVVIYDSDTAVEVSKLPRVYIARKPEEITLEFPADQTYVWEDIPKA